MSVAIIFSVQLRVPDFKTDMQLNSIHIAKLRQLANKIGLQKYAKMYNVQTLQNTCSKHFWNCFFFL